MTVPTPEQEPQGHPAWAEILNDVPEDLRPILEPKLQEWDRHYSTKLQSTVEQYKPYENYKELVENNVPLDLIQKSVWLAKKIEEDPEYVIKQINENFDLNYAPVTTSSQEEEEEEFEFDGDFDITKHPAFQQLQQQSQQVQQMLEQQRQAQEEEESINGLQAELAALHEEFDTKDEEGNVLPGFDDLYVTALMAQGVDPKAAVQSFNETINQRVQALAGLNPPSDTNPPVIMGGDGSTGSGIPKEPVSMGGLGKGQLNDLVLQMLQGNQQQ